MGSPRVNAPLLLVFFWGGGVYKNCAYCGTWKKKVTTETLKHSIMWAATTIKLEIIPVWAVVLQADDSCSIASSAQMDLHQTRV